MRTTDTSAERDEMVHHQIEARGVRDRLVLKAMRKVPREEFVPENMREFAFDDVPLPIAEEQTISLNRRPDRANPSEAGAAPANPIQIQRTRCHDQKSRFALFRHERRA